MFRARFRETTLAFRLTFGMSFVRALVGGPRLVNRSGVLRLRAGE